MIGRALLLAAGLAAVTAACAHPIHASYAEIDFRPDPAHLEIAIRLFSDDAEASLSARAGKKIILERTPAPELDALLLALGRDGLVVKAKTGSTQTLVPVGHELKDGGQHLWLYFTCSLPGGIDGALFAHRLLRDRFSDQLNSIRLRDHSVAPTRQATLLFTDDREQRVAFP